MATIYALSSAAGKAAIGIVRISGPRAWRVAETLTRGRAPPLKTHLARVANIYGAKGLLDQAVVLPFAENRSYTGEPLVELHCHGSPAVLAAVMHELGSAGCRHAEPGEFTKRAFYNGKLDLTKVEGIRDLLNAETELQRQLAVSGAAGNLADLYHDWRRQMVENTAVLTALIDFADDNELEASPNSLISRVETNVRALYNEVQQHTLGIQKSEIIAAGIQLAVLGEPNAGKSSLVNRLVNRSASIVSAVAGTTRDVVQVSLDIDGYKLIIGDTAGLRTVEGTQDHDELERIGIERARETIKQAHIVLAVHPLDRPLAAETLAEIEDAKRRGSRVLVVGSKADLAGKNRDDSGVDVCVSSKTGEGFGRLAELMAEKCHAVLGNIQLKDMVGASRRTRELLDESVLPGLEQCLVQLENSDATLASAELQLAIDGIGKITAKAVGVNEVLDIVFGSFCIGK